MPLIRNIKGYPETGLLAEGTLEKHPEHLTSFQKQCARRLGLRYQMQQEFYLSQHPEVIALLEIFVQKMINKKHRLDVSSEAVKFFTQPFEELDAKVRHHLKLPAEGPYTHDDRSAYVFGDTNFKNDLMQLYANNFPLSSYKAESSCVPTPDTMSSSFLSIITSDTTVPTPEPIPTPEPTISEIFYNLVSTTVDKAIYQNFNDEALLFDTAYLEVSKAIEECMEIPIINIRVDIATFLFNVMALFEANIMEKERIAAEIAREKRMRKKLKRTVRQLDNFKGYVTPPTPKSEVSSHPSYLLKLPKPCVCSRKFTYNRYDKDRFGIYLPLEEIYETTNITVTPVISPVPSDTEDAVKDKEGK